MKEKILTMRNMKMNSKNITAADRTVSENPAVFNINPTCMQSGMQNLKTGAELLTQKNSMEEKMKKVLLAAGILVLSASVAFPADYF
ncbi:MAG: hypothetical protein KAJ10_09285 [Thermodesulfovibrionia bacterium]|nr:hypothetical protein [Thermodesulfovibrionia bacterium]